MKLLFTILLSCVLLVAGCARTSPSYYYRGQTDANAANAQIKLSEAAVSASQSLNQMAEIQQAVTPPSKMRPPFDPNSIGMGQLTSVDWTGPVEPLVNKIANACNYQLRVLGRKPSIPVIVSVSAKDMPLGTILRDVSFQALNQADIVVYPQRRMIELRYLNT